VTEDEVTMPRAKMSPLLEDVDAETKVIEPRSCAPTLARTSPPIRGPRDQRKPQAASLPALAALEARSERRRALAAAAAVPAPDTVGEPERASRRFAPLLARWVAVAAGAPGEIRLVPLDAAAPPAGAAVAILVPASAADGDILAKLLGARE